MCLNCVGINKTNKILDWNVNKNLKLSDSPCGVNKFGILQTNSTDWVKVA